MKHTFIAMIALSLLLFSTTSIGSSTNPGATTNANAPVLYILNLRILYQNTGEYVTIPIIPRAITVEAFRERVRKLLRIPFDKQLILRLAYQDLENETTLAQYDIFHGSTIYAESY